MFKLTGPLDITYVKFLILHTQKLRHADVMFSTFT